MVCLTPANNLWLLIRDLEPVDNSLWMILETGAIEGNKYRVKGCDQWSVRTSTWLNLESGEVREMSRSPAELLQYGWQEVPTWGPLM